MATELTKEQFIEILNNRKITKEIHTRIFKTIYKCEGRKATASEIGRTLGYIKNPSGVINLEVGERLGKKVAKEYNITLSKRGDGTEQYWKLFFSGRYEGKLFAWKLKPSLIYALEETGLTNPHEYTNEDNPLQVDYKDYTESQDVELAKAKKLTSEQRRKLLINTQTKPEKIKFNRTEYKRNQLVVAEVRYRANGKCDYCRNPAPFQRDKDGEGYLEIHHILPLADGGSDTLDNAAALCPNCHRQAHFGKKNFDIENLKMTKY
jgi:predicted HNH restriction endonuclease